MRKLKRGIVVLVTITITLIMLSSCRLGGEEKKSIYQNSKDYANYTVMLEKFPLGSQYNDIIAYLDEQNLFYSTNSDNLPQIQVFGGQLFFDSQNRLHSLFSTAWMHPDGWGVGSALDEVQEIYGDGEKRDDTEKITYMFKSGNTTITVVFDEHFIVQQWAIS